MDPKEKPQPILCANERLLAEYLTVFVRDMALQHKKVLLTREGNTILCKDPQRAWTVMTPYKIL